MSGERPAIAWNIDVSLLGQPSMRRMFLKVILFSAGLMGGLLVFLSLVLGNRDMVAPMLGLTAISAGVVAVLLLFVVLVVFRNRMSMGYLVDEKGVRSTVLDRRARVAGKLAIIAGVLGGKPGVAGAGLLSASSWQQEIAWRAVRSVDCSPRWRTVKLANAWRTVMILYCRPENYETVADRAVRAVAAQPARPTVNPVPGLLLRSALIVLGCLPLFFLPSPIRIDNFVPWLALCFGLATVWFLPIFGWVVIGCVAVVAAQAALRGAQPFRSYLGGETFSRFGLMSGDDWALAGLALAGAALLVWLSIAMLRGRYASALAGDLAEMEIEENSTASVGRKTGAHVCPQCGGRLNKDGKCARCDARQAR